MTAPYVEDGVTYLELPCVRCGTMMEVADAAVQVADSAKWPLCSTCRGITLSFAVVAKPEPRGSKTGKFHRDSNPQSYPWMDKVSSAAAEAMDGRALLIVALRVDLDFYLNRPAGHYGTGRNAESLRPSAPARPITKPDAGKLARGTVDAMEGIVYRNDSQIVEGDSRKFYGTPTRCEIRITVL